MLASSCLLSSAGLRASKHAIQRLERGASRLGGARLSARSRVVRPLPPLVALALVCSRRAPICKISGARRSPRTGTPTTHPGCDDMPHGGGVGGVVSSPVVVTVGYPRVLKKSPCYRGLAHERSTPA